MTQDALGTGPQGKRNAPKGRAVLFGEGVGFPE
jgi:hypothetical protein